MSSEVINKKIKESSRFCLLHSACRLFSKLGFDKTSTRDIAHDAQVNISMISYHFGGKEGLYNQVLIEFAQKVSEHFESVFHEATHKEMNRKHFLHVMTQIIDHLIDVRIHNPEICTLLAREKIEGLTQSRELHEKLFAPLITKFIEILTLAQKKNVVRKDINLLLFFTVLSEGIWGFFEVSKCQLSKFDLLNDLVTKPVELRNQIIKIYLEGIIL